ncbi:MAG: hypothetical protein ACLU1W_03125 [Collinsella sp.]
MQGTPGVRCHIAQVLYGIAEILSRVAQLLGLIPKLLRLVAQVLQRVGARAVRAALVAGRITRRAVLARELNLEVTVVVIVGRSNDPVGIDDGRRAVVGQDYGVRRSAPRDLRSFLALDQY